MTEKKDLTLDQKIKAFVEQARDLIKKKGIREDARGGWLPARQLQIVRQILAREGFNAALTYQSSKLSGRDNKWEAAKKEVVLDLLRFARSVELDLDLRLMGYLLANINDIVKNTGKEDLK